MSFLVNAGIYLLEPRALELVPPGRSFDMPDLIRELLAAKRTVTSFPVVEYWLDVGQAADYERAQREVNGKEWNA